jgi:hypothetical protein
MSAELKSRFRASAKICSGVIIILLLVAALGPAQWAPRTELGWQFDHFIGYTTNGRGQAKQRNTTIPHGRRGFVGSSASSDAGSIS